MNLLSLHYKNLFITICAVLLLPAGFAAAQSNGFNNYSLNLSDTTIEAGESITVSWEADAADNLNRDWIGLYRTGQSNVGAIDWEYVTNDSGGFTFTVDDPGEYEFRYFKNDGYTRAVVSEEFTVENRSFDDYSLTLLDTTIEAGESITVRWEADARDNLNRDWIGLYRTGQPNVGAIDWEYVGNDAGDLTFEIENAGEYEFRYFKNDSYTTAVVSAKFTVESRSFDDYTLSVADTTIMAGESITVSWEADARDNINQDWIGLYEIGDPDRGQIDWEYVTDDSGSLTFTVDDAGDYEFRYFKNNSYNRAAISDEFVVEEPSFDNYSLSLSDSIILTGETITVTWQADNNDNLDKDWVGLYHVGRPDKGSVDWGYINDDTGGFEFTVPNVGDYEFRYFKNDSYRKVAVSDSFRVNRSDDDTGEDTPEFQVVSDFSDYEVGEIATAIWAAPAGRSFLLDWIGLYRVGDSDRNYQEFEYIDAFSFRETFRLREAGEFEFRYFTSNSYNRQAVSDSFTVGSGDNTDLVCNGFNLRDINNLPSDNPNGPIIALGDSITFGIGASPNQNYVDELEKKFDVSIINAGVPADTTQDVLNRLDSDVLSLDPSTVIVFIGGNDELRRVYDSLSNSAADRNLADELDDFVRNQLGFEWDEVPLISKEQTYANLERIVTDIQATGANTIIVGFDNVIYDDSVAANYEMVANDTGSFYIPDIYNDIFGRVSRMSDLVHPNNVGYEIVADRIGRALECTI